MAIQRLCSIPDCGKPARGHGLCSAHYTRWRRRGDPLGVSTSHGEPARFVAETVLPYDGVDCLIWPYGRNKHGYAFMWHNKTMAPAYRIVCEQAHGAPPTPKHEAAHSCGKGKNGCVNPHHLSWKTKAGNQADRLEHGTHQLGTKNAMVKLTEDDVRTIRALKGQISTRDIAAKFGVGRMAIGKIHRRERWGWLD